MNQAARQNRSRLRSRRGPKVIGAMVWLTLASLVAAPAASASGGGPKIGGLWLLDEGSGQVAREWSGNANNGTLGSTASVDANDPTWIPGAYRGTKALSFGGDDFVSVPNSPSLESARVTVGAVVRSSSPGPFRYVASKGALQCQTASYGLYTGASGGLSFYVSDGLSYTLSPDAGVNVWDGRWHLVAGTFDGATVRLYVDGSQVGTGSPSTIVTNYGMPDENRFFIGAYGGPCPTPLGFVGDIEAVGVLQDVVNWHP